MKRIFISFILFFSSVTLAESPKSLITAPLEKPLPANLFIELAKLINPAVVNILTQTAPEEKLLTPNPRQRDPLMDLFEQFMGPMDPKQFRPREALGTGFVIRKDGLIITNNHVVQGASKITVKFDQKGAKSYEAKLIGRDSRTDIALIKIEENSDFPITQLGDSDQLNVGEWVAAFGNPLGLGHTMTKGIISAKGREINELNRFPFLQTDASINPGNSGGPLVDTNGYVIGVNSAIAQGNGIGFAIPINDVKFIIKKLEKSGRVVRGFIGVNFSELTEQAIRYFKLKSNEGVLIADVVPGGPADKAGIKSGDLLLKFEDKKLYTSQDLVNSVANSDIDSQKDLLVLRNGKKKTITVKIGTHPEDLIPEKEELTSINKNDKNYQGQKAPFDLGFFIESFSKGLAQKYSLGNELDNPIVLNIVDDSPADKAGLTAGDQILSVNQKNVRSAKDVIRRLIKGPNALIIQRRGNRQFVFIEP